MARNGGGNGWRKLGGGGGVCCGLTSGEHRKQASGAWRGEASMASGEMAASASARMAPRVAPATRQLLRAPVATSATIGARIAHTSVTLA